LTLKFSSIFFAIFFFAASVFANESRLTFATWNTRWQSQEDVEKGDNWKKRVEPIVNVIRFFDFDIVAMQENSAAKQRDLEPLLTGYEFIQNDTMEYNPIVIKKGMFKVLEKGRFYLSKTPYIKSKSWDSKNYRYCTWAKLQKDSSVFYVFNTHFDYHGKIAKEESAKLLNQVIPSMVKESAYILAGDFNSTEGSKAYNTLVSSSYIKDSKHLAEVVHLVKNSYNYFDPMRVSKWDLDHIFVAPGTKVFRYGVLNETYFDGETYRYPSDHSPIMVIMESP